MPRGGAVSNFTGIPRADGTRPSHSSEPRSDIGGTFRRARRESGERADACRGHSAVVLMIVVSPGVFRKLVLRATAATRDGVPSPVTAPRATTVPSKPELTPWKR